MIQKKVCMLGAFAVGKTSLVKQYVKSIFSEDYHTTVGVVIDKKVVDVDDRQVTMMLWDLHGEDEFQKVRMSYLRGMAGYILVIDGTRPVTLERVITLQKDTESAFGQIPFVLALNKSDLENDWRISDETIVALRDKGWKVFITSAKSGDEVESLFHTLAKDMVGA